MHRSRALFAFTVCAAVAAAPARAQQTDTVVYRIEGIEVGASRAVTTVGGTSALEVTPDSLSLPVGASVEELFRVVPGIHVRTNSRGEAEVAVRGSESRQVAILVDGSPITLGWDARTDVSVLPLDAIRELTFVRGLSSLLYGPNTLGGVVDIAIARGALPTRASMKAGVGVDDEGGYGVTASATAPVAGSGATWLVRAGAGFKDSPGFPLADGVVEPVPASEPSLRLNTDVRNVDGFAALRYQADGGAFVSLSGAGFKAERGIAGELGINAPRLWRYPNITRTLVSASLGTGGRATPAGRGGIELNLGLDQGHSEIDAFRTRTYQERISQEDGDATTTSIRAVADHTVSSRGSLAAAFTHSNIEHTSIVDGTSLDYQQKLMSVGAETTWRLVDEPSGGVALLSLSFGGVFDRGQTPKTGVLPSQGTIDDWGARGGLSAVTRDGRMLLHAGISRRGRFPALREAYSESLSRFEPNPDLKPEHLVAIEGGVTTALGAGDAQLVGFRHVVSGAIRRVNVPGTNRRKRINSEELRSVGAELLVAQTLGPLRVSGDLTAQSVELVDPATANSNRPENLPELSGSGQLELAMGAGFELDASALYTGTQFCTHPDTGADTRLDGGAWINAGLSKAFTFGGSGPLSRVVVRASADNLADTALYDQCGLPQSGRLLRFQLNLF